MNSTQLLARIKLRELERQRDRLHAHYEAVERSAAETTDPIERLRRLYDGLRGATFAQKPLHPDVANLDALFFEAEVGTAPAEVVADRTRLLERELAQGRLRAEFAYVFGRLLGELTEPNPLPPPPMPESGDPWEVFWEETPPAVDLGWLSAALDSAGSSLANLARKVKEFGDHDAFAPVSAAEVKDVLARLAGDSYRRPELRREASALLGSDTRLNEFAGALTILLNNLDEWDWPADGVELRPLWARNKLRPYLDEDLITALFLQLIGLRWGARLKGLINYFLFTQQPGGSGEPFADYSGYGIDVLRLGGHQRRFMPNLLDRFPTPVTRPGAINAAGYGPDALAEQLTTVQAEIRLLRAADPARPVFVVQADLRDYYPHIPHAAVLHVLERLGVPERWRSFFGKFLRARVRYRGATRTVQRGLVLDHFLADVFAECLLLPFDLRVRRLAGVQSVRVIDDFFLVGSDREQVRRAWEEVRDFCRAAAQEVNAEKSGSACLGGAGSTEGLPAGRPRWGLLRLDADGTWQIDEAVFARLEDTVRRETEAARSVLALAAVYGGYVNFALRQLGLAVPLGEEHIVRAGRRLAKMHDGLFGPGRGGVEEVRRRLGGRFADGGAQGRGLPVALLYWPVTAGGLGLPDPLLHVAAYRKGWQAREEPAVPATKGSRWLQSPEWLGFYQKLATKVEPRGPDATPGMEALVKDFISRGGEVSGRRQEGLSPYWRWVVYTYGPSLLEALGTFRFLMTELVPLQLILEGRGRENLEGSPPEPGPVGGAGGDEIPF